MKLFKNIDDYLKLIIIKNEFKSSKFLDFLLVVTQKKILKNTNLFFKKRHSYFEEFKKTIQKPSSFKKFLKKDKN